MLAGEGAAALVGFVEFEFWALIGTLAAVVGYQLLTGRINTQGLLNDTRTKELDPARAQLLVSTLVVALGYLADRHAFADPFVAVGAASVVGGSNLIYLVQKYRSLLM